MDISVGIRQTGALDHKLGILSLHPPLDYKLMEPHFVTTVSSLRPYFYHPPNSAKLQPSYDAGPFSSQLHFPLNPASQAAQDYVKTFGSQDQKYLSCILGALNLILNTGSSPKHTTGCVPGDLRSKKE